MADMQSRLELAVLPLVAASDPGEAIGLSLLRADGSGLIVRLGPAEAIAVAGELIQAARARMGRLDWPPATAIAENAP
jgi:hypothetical protein